MFTLISGTHFVKQNVTNDSNLFNWFILDHSNLWYENLCFKCVYPLSMWSKGITEMNIPYGIMIWKSNTRGWSPQSADGTRRLLSVLSICVSLAGTIFQMIFIDVNIQTDPLSRYIYVFFFITWAVDLRGSLEDSFSKLMLLNMYINSNLAYLLKKMNEFDA